MTSSIQSIQLSEQRFTTQAYINQNPTSIALVPARGNATLKPSGGHDYSGPQAKAVQTFRVVVAASPDGLYNARTDEGIARKFGYWLVGSYDANIDIDDTWDEIAPDGTKIHYRVTSIEPFNGYEVRALVNSFATEPQHGE